MTALLLSQRLCCGGWRTGVGDLDETVLIDGQGAALVDLYGRGEQRRGGDDGVELALLAADIDTGGLELGDQRGLEPATEEALPESLGVDGHDGRLDAGREQLVEQRAPRLEPQRQAGVETGGTTDALDPVAMRLQVDVAEDADFGAQLAQLGEAIQKGGLVGVPRGGATYERRPSASAWRSTKASGRPWL
jgi:hypothetical protein